MTHTLAADPLATSPEERMTPRVRTKPPAIHLKMNDGGGDVVVHDGDDRYMLTVQEAIIACGMFNNIAEFHRQMRLLMDRLTDWISERGDVLRDAYLGVKRAGGLVFLVVTRGKGFNSALEDQLTDLDIEVANASDFSLIQMSVLALPDSPPECVDSFLTNC